MPRSRRRPQVGEVGDSFQSLVKFALDEVALQCGFLRDERVPISLGCWIAKHVGGDCAEPIDQSGIEVLAAPVTGHLPRRLPPPRTPKPLAATVNMKQA